MLPNNQYRIGTTLPTKPATNLDLVRIMATRIPTMLWSQWSLRLAEQNLYQRFLRSVLSVGLLLIGHDIESKKRSRPWAARKHGRAFMLECAICRNHPLAGCPGALYRLSGLSARVAINYHRRRQLGISMAC